MNKIIKKVKQVSRICVLSINCVFLFNASAKNADYYESSQNIRNTAKVFLEEMTSSADITDTELNIGNIDPRLKLRKCGQPLIAYLPPGSKHTGKINVGIKCVGPIQWKMFLSASSYQYQTVIYAKNTLKKGQTINRQDLGKKRVKIDTRNKQPAFDYSEVALTSPRRFIRAGAIIFTDAICMVCRGNRVNVSTGNEYFSINVEAEALADASIGEMVRLRNKNSRRIFDGKVVGRNKAQVVLLK